MPRKTKKKKIIADYRKKMSKIQPTATAEHVVAETSPAKKKIRSKKKKSPVKSVRSVNHQALERQKRLIAGDLRKTLILSTLAIGSLIVISLVPIN